MRIAVIGAGISGNLAARLLASRHEVHLFESQAKAGGHTHTLDVELHGSTYTVDTGFMVFNDRTYPNFRRMLELLVVPQQLSDMSFSVSCERTGLEYQGSSLNGLFAQRRNLVSPRFYRLLRDILRFNALARQLVASPDPHERDSSETEADGSEADGSEADGSEADGSQAAQLNCPLRDFLNRERFGQTFIDQYLLPMSAAIWSSSPGDILNFSTGFLLRFFQNHGLIQLRDRPQWMTIPRGARQYVQKLLAPLSDQVHLNCPVNSVRRFSDHVEVEVGERVERFDLVVFACHADQALQMLETPSVGEQEVLSAFPYHPNQAILHTDITYLPKRRPAWASWNYRVPDSTLDAASVTYDLSRLQRVASPVPILLTLNPHRPVAAEHVHRTIEFHHPGFQSNSVPQQQRWDELNGSQRSYFCGAYWRYGFHEDGVRSALAVVDKILHPETKSATRSFTSDTPSSLLSLLESPVVSSDSAVNTFENPVASPSVVEGGAIR